MANKSVTMEALEKLEDQLECTICLQSYTNPKVLPCFHVFCKDCLEQTVLQDQGEPAIVCPKCRLPIPLSPSGVAALPSAFHINHLLEIQDILQKAKEPRETHCENCRKAMATGFCHDCGKFMCEKCIEVHELWEEFNEHQVVGLSEVQEQALNFSPSRNKVLYCSKHSKRELKIYCDTCAELLCVNCTVRSHLGHQYDLVTDTAPRHQDEIQAHLQSVRQRLEMVNKALQALDARTKQIGDQRMAVEADIHKQIDQLHQALDQRRAELIGQLDHITQRKLKSLAAQRDQTEMLHAQLTSCLEYVEGSLTTSTPAEVLAMKEPMIKQIKEITQDLSPDSLAPKEEANLQLEGVVTNTLEGECHTFGGVPQLPNHLGPTQGTIFGVSSKQGSVGKQTRVTQTTAEMEKEVSLPHKESTITQHDLGSKQYAIMPHESSKSHTSQSPTEHSSLPAMIKLMSQNIKSPFRTIKNVSNPKGIALNGSEQILVSEGGGKDRVSVYSPGGQKVKTFGKVQTPWGICLDSGGRILVVGHTDHQVHRFTSNGEHLQSVGGRGKKPLQFRSPVGIAYSEKSGKVYVSEWGNHRVQVLNEDLSFSDMFGTQGSGDGQLLYPAGVATDSRGNVYVADHGNDRVQVFTPEGKFSHALGTKGSGLGQIDRPQDVYVDQTDTVFVVDFGNNRISVFTAQGQFLTSFGQGHFADPIGLTVDENGLVIVSDYTRKQVLMF